MPSRLDFKLGVRMLLKHPGLTLAGGAGIAVAVAIAVGAFSAIHGSFLSNLPLHEGHRVVSLELWDTAQFAPQPRLHHDYLRWRTELTSLQQLSAFRDLTANLILPATQPETIRVAAITASAFPLARVAPLTGRHLLPSDQLDGAPPVIVISESVWRNRFAADPAILSRIIQLGATPHAIVGVMPQSFAFPINHQYWIPLRLTPAPSPLAGPAIHVFARLTPDATLSSAQSELTAAFRRAAHANPHAYAHLQPRLLPYTHPFTGIHEASDFTSLLAMQAILVTLLVLVCLNVAILVYTRTAMRHAEISLRTALGAGRARIVAQLFIESLVMSLAATLAGIVIAVAAFHRIKAATIHLHADLPFWISFRLHPQSILYAAALSVFAAAIVGIIPALRATRREVLHNLRIIGAGGSGMRLGRTWTVLIVAQVAFAVALLPPAVANSWKESRDSLAPIGFDAHRFLTAQLGLDNAAPGRFATLQTELLRRLAADPRVAAVSFALTDPGNEPGARIEIPTPQHTELHSVRSTRVGASFFQAFQLPILAGRTFDLESVLVNQSLANTLFQGNALGRRFRYANEPARSYEITGIVPDFPTGVSQNIRDTPLKIYHATSPGEIQPSTLAIHLRDGDATAFIGPLRQIAAAVDPELHLRTVRRLDEALRSEQWISRLQAAVFLGLTVSVLLLSTMGVYALMSFTVSQRRKEIAIRMALGASRNRILAGIFSRALTQLAAGAALGAILGAALERAITNSLTGTHIVLTIAAVILAVGLLAAFGPARRTLHINPSQALRDT
ncbi:MAG: ABC transporter permease [Bryobacterales bacterium]|nr:ABC transporter permease [Bryobacterales bacterium]